MGVQKPERRPRTEKGWAWWRNLAGAVGLVFAAAAGAGQLLTWPVWLRLALFAVGALGGLVAVVLLFFERRARQRDEDDEAAAEAKAAAAVGLFLMREDDGTTLLATNHGDFVVQDIRIATYPRNDKGQALPLLLPPKGGVAMPTPFAGGWFSADVDQLHPNNGIGIARYEEADGDDQRVGIDVIWIDHNGRRRQSQVSADLRECAGPYAELDVRPLKPK